MAISINKDYWVHSLTVSDNYLETFEQLVANGKGDYVAGLLIGMLKTNSKLVVYKENGLNEDDLKKI